MPEALRPNATLAAKKAYPKGARPRREIAKNASRSTYSFLANLASAQRAT
jgi:hypothetical protein